MKIPAPDNRKPIAVPLKLDAATYDLIQLYKEYRADGGAYFTTDSQVIGAVCSAFFEEGDDHFKRWRKTRPPKAVTTALVKVEKKSKKANGVDLSAPSKLTFGEERVDGAAAAKVSVESEQK